MVEGPSRDGGLAKRVISVGFVTPKTLEGNTIYVNLEKHGNEIGATAVSTENFKYQDKQTTQPPFLSSQKKISNMDYTRKEGLPICHSSYVEFIHILARENEAIVIYRRALMEGIEAHNTLEEIQREAAHYSE